MELLEVNWAFPVTAGIIDSVLGAVVRGTIGASATLNHASGMEEMYRCAPICHY